MLDLGFTKCIVEHCVYVKEGTKGDLVIICLYVDDLLVTGSNIKDTKNFKKIMEAEFEITDLGRLSYFLGMEFTYTAVGMIVHQKKYAGEILKRFNMISCNAVMSPIEVNLRLARDESGDAVDETKFKRIIGSLRYLCNSRPDLDYSVGLVSRFMSNPKKLHMLATKRLLRYIQGTTDYGILFPIRQQKSELEVVGS